MRDDHPPKVDLARGVMGPLALLRRGSRNTVAAIPVEALHAPVLSGRMGWMGHAVSGPEEMKHVLATNGANYPRSRVMRSLMGPPLSHSLFLADDRTHRWLRRSVLRLYGGDRRRAHVPLVREHARREAGRLPPGPRLRFDAAAHMEAVSLSAALEVACATYVPEDPAALRRALDAFGDNTLRVTLFDVLGLPLRLVALLKSGGRGRLYALRRDMDRQIRARPAHPAPPDDLLQLLLDLRDPETGQPLTRRQVLDNLLMMIVASYEPPASALSWAVYLLATHPDAQERARAEAQAMGAGEAGGRDADAPFLTAVIHETMRLYPVVPIILRDTLAPDTVGACPVGKGSFVFLPFYALHRSPDHWTDPDSFRPERFLAPDCPGAAFLPFSTGARSCLGKSFAMIEIRVVLADLLSRFRFTATPGRRPRPESVMSLRPRGGVWIDAERL